MNETEINGFPCIFALRASELEIENEKLHKDVLLLRNSINRGIAEQELEGTSIECQNHYVFVQKFIIFQCHFLSAQFVTLEEENKRRRDECIQLRSILAQRSHGSPTKMAGFANHIDHSDDSMLQESELMQAFEAQKVVNRQLESELTALTEENNSKILDLSHEIDDLRAERNELLEILHNQIRSTDSTEEYHYLSAQDTNSTVQKQQNIDYLMQEIKSISAAYVQVMVNTIYKIQLKESRYIVIQCNYRLIIILNEIPNEIDAFAGGKQPNVKINR